MKNIFLILLLTGCVLQSTAQGSLIITPGTFMVSVNNAYLVIDNVNLVNNGILIQAIGSGTTRFTGNMDVSISGTSPSRYDRWDVDKNGSTVKLMQNITVGSELNFTSGLIDVGNSVLDLGTVGMLKGERENSRIYSFGAGYVQAMNLMNMPSMANPGNLGATITSNKNLGNVTVKRGHLAQNISGTSFGIRRYYDILSAIDNGLKATVRLNYFDSEVDASGDTVGLEFWEGNKTKWINDGFTSRDIIQNYVEKTNLNSLSTRWTLAPAKKDLHSVITLISGKITIPPPVADNYQLKNQLSVWPNPALQFVNVTISTVSPSVAILKLYDSKGSLLLTKPVKLIAGKNFMTLDIKNLAEGTYNLIAQLGQSNEISQKSKLSQIIIKGN